MKAAHERILSVWDAVEHVDKVVERLLLLRPISQRYGDPLALPVPSAV